MPEDTPEDTSRPSHHALVRDLRAGMLARAPDEGRHGREGREHRRRRPGRAGGRRLRRAWRLLVVLIVGTVLVLGLRAVGSSGEQPDRLGGGAAAPAALTAEPSAPVGVEAWAQVVAELDVRRSAALTAGDVAAVRALHLPTSTALRADLRAVRALRAARLRPDGLRAVVVRVEPRGRSPEGRVRLRVVDRRPAYRLLASDGSVVRRVPARGERAWRVVLDGSGSRWRIAAVNDVTAVTEDAPVNDDDPG